MTYKEWALQYPDAAAVLQEIVLRTDTAQQPAGSQSEAWAQQHARMDIARGGALAWRNNVGATPARCPRCQAEQRPVRYGLANDSQQLNRRVKSSDLIGVRPLEITQDMVGQTVGQFLAVECKPPGWVYRGDDHEAAQLAFHALVQSKGGLALFSTGRVNL